MTFYRYMMRNHRGKNTEAGKLAAAMERQRERFPKNGPGKYDGWHTLLLDHIQRSESFDGLVPAFETCWAEYEKHCRDQRRKYR